MLLCCIQNNNSLGVCIFLKLTIFQLLFNHLHFFSRINDKWENYIYHKKCKGSEILPYLSANKLACCGFTDAGRRHELLGSETKYFINCCTTRNMSFMFVQLFLSFHVPQGCHGTAYVDKCAVGLCSC